MTKAEIIHAISKHYLPLPDACIADLIAHSKLLEVGKQTELVREGQYSDKVFYIARGSARAYLLKDGRDVSDWFAFENEFVSSINSFFANVPSPHFIETIEPSLLLELQRDKVLELAEKYPAFSRLEKKILVDTLLKLQYRIAAMQFETAQQKYLRLLAVRPDIADRIPVTHMASYLGITIETLSRIRHAK